MKFDRPTINLIIDYINKRWPEPRRCPICGNLTWNVNDRPMEVRECMGGAMVIGGEVQYMPVIVITCGYCGYVILLNGFATGILKPINQPQNTILPPDEPEPPEEPEVPEDPKGQVIN